LPVHDRGSDAESTVTVLLEVLAYAAGGVVGGIRAFRVPQFLDRFFWYFGTYIDVVLPLQQQDQDVVFHNAVVANPLEDARVRRLPFVVAVAVLLLGLQQQLFANIPLIGQRLLCEMIINLVALLRRHAFANGRVQELGVELLGVVAGEHGLPRWVRSREAGVGRDHGVRAADEAR